MGHDFCQVIRSRLVFASLNEELRHPESRLIQVRRVAIRIFQIRDDVLGIWGGPALGKPVGADITRKKNSLPVVHVFEHARDADRRELERIYSENEIAGDDVERVLEVMDGLGTQRWCQDQAETRWGRARRRLASLRVTSDATREFLELGEYLLVRDA